MNVYPSTQLPLAFSNFDSLRNHSTMNKTKMLILIY